MFKAGSKLKDKAPEEIFYQDSRSLLRKAKLLFGVGQISSMDSEELLEIKEKLLPFLMSECERRNI